MVDSCKMGVHREGVRRPCRLPASRDGYCAVHHPDAVQERDNRKDRRYREKVAAERFLFQANSKKARATDSAIRLVRSIALAYDCSESVEARPPDDCDCDGCEARRIVERLEKAEAMLEEAKQ